MNLFTREDWESVDCNGVNQEVDNLADIETYGLQPSQLQYT